MYVIKRLHDVGNRGNRLAGYLKPLQVERDRHEGPLAKEGQMPGRDVAGIGAILYQDMPFPRFQIQQGDTRLQIKKLPRDSEQHALTVRETLGKAVAEFFICPIGRGQRFRLCPVSRDPEEAHVVVGRKDDVVVAPPTGPEIQLEITQGDGDTAINWDLLQLLVRPVPESNPPPIR